MSRYWDATQSQGDVEVEVEVESEVDERYCVIRGECLGHPKCYQKGTRFDGYCFIHARADAMGDYSGNWSDGSDWGLDGDERAWRAKYSSPNRHSESESEGEAEGEGEGEAEGEGEGED